MSAANPVTTRRSPIRYVPEPWPGDITRIGMILLSVDRASETEVPRMTPPDLAQFHVDRIPMPSPCTVENLRAMGPELTSTAARLLPGTQLDAVIFACTSGASVIGTANVRDFIQQAHPDVPVITPIQAATRALRALGSRRIAVLTPYIDGVNATISSHLVDNGFEITGFDSFLLEEDSAMSAVPPQAIHDAALALNHEEADALFISCTALRPSSVIEAIEQRIGKPVVTSHQAMIWDTLRQSARKPVEINGFGRLLREFPLPPDTC